ncbi:uncharacterized protein HaLaN_17923, partial [Haematococcus lacustris]
SGVQGCERRHVPRVNLPSAAASHPHVRSFRCCTGLQQAFPELLSLRKARRGLVPGSVIAQSDMYLMWRPRTMAEVTPESLVFLELITPTPEVLVLGCGATAQPLPAPVAAYLASRGMKVEVLDSRNATGYFNILNEEGRVVVGALLAADPSLPLLEDLPEKKDPIYDRAWLKN